MCCSMTCWDCMIMQDSDIIVSSRPDSQERELKKLSKIKGLRHFSGLEVTQKSHIFQTL